MDTERAGTLSSLATAALVMLAAVLIASCGGEGKAPPAGATASPAVVTPTTPAQQGALTLRVCVLASEWERPSADEHFQHIRGDPRYVPPGGDIPQFLRDAFKWNFYLDHTASASGAGRFGALTGLWSLNPLDESLRTGQCGTFEEQEERVRRGETANLWAIGHEVVAVAVERHRYVVIVRPLGRGFRIVEIAGLRPDLLPWHVVDEDGRLLAQLDGQPFG